MSRISTEIHHHHCEKSIIVFFALLAFGFLFLILDSNTIISSNVQDFFKSRLGASITTTASSTKDYDTTNWAIYKHTTSITPGSATTVSDFVNSYIGRVSMVEDLGCSTVKVVSSYLYPYKSDSVLGFYEVHWVDSDVFQTTGQKSVQEWNEYIESVSNETDSIFNNFMHNKVQLFVADLEPLYQLLDTDGISSYKHLSSSNGSITLDVAHIGIVVKEAAMIYEIIGPASSLNKKVTDNYFSEWSSEECPSAHVLPKSIEYYEDIYDSLTSTGAEDAWMSETGLYLPMVIRVTIPASALTLVQNSVDLVTTITNATVVQFDDEENQCSLLALSWDDSSDYFNPEITYVVNYNSQDTEFTIADWEDDVSLSHSSMQSNSSWDRYLDSHLGVAIDDTSLCSGNVDFIEESINDNLGQFMYSQRESGGSHFYVGNSGLRSWEFNVLDCMLDGIEICGCISSNNNLYYLDYTGNYCTRNSTTIA